MNLPAAILLLCLGGYLIGGIPFGFLVGRMKGIDVRTAGSGNIGATNVSRLIGRKWGVAVFVLDMAKGLVPVLIAGWILKSGLLKAPLGPTGRTALWLVTGVCCVVGHNYSIYLRFRGGKGVATSLGVVLGIFPYLTVAGLLAAIVWVIVTWTTRYVSVGSVSAAAAMPVLLALCLLWRGYAVLAENWPLLVFAGLAGGLVIYRHRENLARLRSGTERRIGSGR